MCAGIRNGVSIIPPITIDLPYCTCIMYKLFLRDLNELGHNYGMINKSLMTSLVQGNYMLTLQLQIPATVTRVMSMPSVRLILLIPVDTTAAVSILTLVVVNLEIVDVSSSSTKLPFYHECAD